MDNEKNVENQNVINNSSPNNNQKENMVIRPRPKVSNFEDKYYHSNSNRRTPENNNQLNNNMESLPKDDGLRSMTSPNKPKPFAPTGANVNSNLNSLGNKKRKNPNANYFMGSQFNSEENDENNSSESKDNKQQNSSDKASKEENNKSENSNKNQAASEESKQNKEESKLSKLNNSLNKVKDLKNKSEKKAIQNAIIKKILKNPYVLIFLLAALILLLLLIIIIGFFASDSAYGAEYAFSENQYWWPVGSESTSIMNGKTFAIEEPAPCAVTSEFGYRIHPTKKVWNFHSGIDIAPTVDTRAGIHNIIASRSGKVIMAKSYSGYGNAVIIEHSNGFSTLYGHLDSINVTTGESVEQGQVIGKMGSTGVSTGTHLHFEVRENDNPVNPLDYISIDEPRRQDIQSESNFNFNLLKTSLTKQEFASRLKKYNYNNNYEKDFKNQADLIYDISIKNNVNPELVVVTAQTETSFNPRNGYNYWGIAVYNNSSSGAKYNTMEEGIKAYSELIHSYTDRGTSLYNLINNRYEERFKANCRAGSYGKPDTIEGMQSVYSSLTSNGKVWNEANCKIMKAYINAGIMKDTYNEVYYSDRCGNKKQITTCEYADYTYYQVWQKVQIKNTIFGG